jgi:hypothetical protein
MSGRELSATRRAWSTAVRDAGGKKEESGFACCILGSRFGFAGIQKVWRLEELGYFEYIPGTIHSCCTDFYSSI